MTKNRKRYAHKTRTKFLAGTGGLYQVQRRQPNGSWVWCIATMYTTLEGAESARKRFDEERAAGFTYRKESSDERS